MNHDILTLTDVRKSFGDAQIIRGVNLAVRAGERHAVIGFHLMSGSFAPTSGDISLQSRAIGGLAPERINRLGLARSFQITNVFPRLSVRENLRLAVLRMHGLVYTFWRPIARNRAVNERGPPAGKGAAGTAPARGGRRPELFGTTLAGNRHDAGLAAARDPAGRAHGRHVAA